MVLDQLKKAGSDLSQPHEIDNYIYFADQASAQEAANRLAASSKEVTANPAAQGSGWVTKADGWGAPIAKNA